MGSGATAARRKQEASKLSGAPRMSQFVWLDYSEHERRTMLDIVDLFREHDTRDEFKIGSVRDTFADLFFPGTSTIMTHARYFPIVPWIIGASKRSVSNR